MNLIHNITVNNGWAMAMTGAIIVLCGLSVLALIISQLHRVIHFFESRKIADAPLKAPPTTNLAMAEADILNDPGAAARIYQPLTKSLGEKFPLNSLYEIFNQENIAHPHLTIRTLREAGFLEKVADNFFRWKPTSN